MTRILAIDPGSERSGWALLDGETVVMSGKTENDELLGDLRMLGGGISLREWNADVVVIEWTAPRGMPASAQLFEALWWAGRFAEAAGRTVGDDRVHRLNRADVKRHHTGRTACTDANIRAALIDRYGGIGGRDAAIGRKASPGPLHGVKADAWQALALGLAWLDQHPEETR